MTWFAVSTGLPSAASRPAITSYVGRFVQLMNTANTDKDMALDVSAGLAVWLEIPAGVLAIAVAVLALAQPKGPAYGYMASQIAM